MSATPRPPLVVSGPSRRDLFLAGMLGAAVLGFLVWAILSMSSQVGGKMLAGTIIAKNFKPHPEQQITVGRDGLNARHVDGEYSFTVQVEGDNNYTVWVDKELYDTRKLGDKIYFVRPAATTGAAH